MKKSIKFLGPFVFLVFLVFTGCQKETIGTTTFEATMEECQDDDGKTAFTNGTMNWVNGDQIKVFGSAGSGVYQATVRSNGKATFRSVSGDAGEAPYRAVYPASAANDDGTVELPVVQVTEDGSLTGFPMYAQGSSTKLDFKNLCGVLRMRLEKSGVSITAIEVTGDIKVTGDYNVVYSGGVPTLEYSDKGLRSTMMTCTTPQSIATQKDFYIFLPVHTYTGMRIRIYSSDGGVCTKTVSAGNTVRIQRGKITTITLRDNSLTFDPDAGSLPGLFTIDAEGHQVRFSQGNLQYTTLGSHVNALGSYVTGTWHFASDQYVGLHYDNQNISCNYSKWIDLFGWGTGNNPTFASNNYLDYATFDDWSFNAISNGGNVANLWRVLTKDEWTYLFFTRTNLATNVPVPAARFARVQVNGVNGMMLFPDGYVHPTTVPAPQKINDSRSTGWDVNIYTQAQWDEMEAAGAVFLPLTGYRYGTEVNSANFYGMYWSSSRDDVVRYEFGMWFASYFVEYNGFNRSYGLGVRPVRDED